MKIYGLTKREVEILRLFRAGWRNKEIANRLELDPRTVSTHTTSALRRLDVRTVAQAVALIVEYEEHFECGPEYSAKTELTR